MTTQTPIFNTQQFEERDYISKWFTSTQKTAVDLTASRVSANLDFVSQFLGWAPSPNYWETLRDTLSQGRQLLGGTFGVYNSFAVADVLSVENWTGNIVLSRVSNLALEQKAFLGDYVYTISSLVEGVGTQTIQLQEGLTDQFLSDLAANKPLRLDIIANRPEPFYRPEVGVSGDAVFVTGTSGTTLTLYPGWDKQQTLPYKVNVFILGATYYFNAPVYLSYTSTLSEDVSCFYLEDLNLWALTIPPVISSAQTSLTAYLVAPYGNSTVQTNATLQVGITSWVDPSDWNTTGVLNNFWGAWGNKGGTLPFNLAFDSLGLHGFNETNSVLLGQVSRSLAFDDLVQKVYQQETYVTPVEPTIAKPYDTWWNTETGTYSVYYPSNGPYCSAWVEIEYRELPSSWEYEPFLTYPDVTSWQVNAATIDVGIAVLIEDFSGLAVTDDVLGVQGTLTGPGFLFIQKDLDGYWQPLKFQYWNVADFSVDAQLLPYNVPVFLYDAVGLVSSNTNYSITDLPFSVTTDLQVILRKQYTNTQWTLAPDNLLKYVANTALFTGINDGELTWDWSNADPWNRALAVFYGVNWVDVTQAGFTTTPTPTLDSNVVRILCDGNLLTDGVSYQTSNYSLSYTYNTVTGNYDFIYNPLNFLGTVETPSVVIADSLTAAFTADITSEVFSGLQWYFSPNVYDAETPLRLWKIDALQEAGTLNHLAENNYYNPLLADQNLGPGAENWERSFIRLPPAYGRNQTQWNKTNLVVQDFGYFSTSPKPQLTECPPETNLPIIYEEAYLYNLQLGNFEYIYSEPFLYSQTDFGYGGVVDDFANSGTYPVTDFPFDEWSEAYLETYDPLHERQARTDLPPGQGYGNWVGAYSSTTQCEELTGFWVNDIQTGVLDPIIPPVWDASIFKFPPTCNNNPESYVAEFNNTKVCYAYFAADLAAAEDAFFDVTQEAAWRYPVNLPRTGYLLPRG